MPKRALELEKQIERIQKSTRTLFWFFVPIHNWFRTKSKLYYFWSLKPYSRTVHWLILFICILGLFASNFSPGLPTETKAEASVCGFPSWYLSNPGPTKSTLRSTYIYDENNIWSVGDNGTILKSSDKGESWRSLYIEQRDYNFYGIDGIDKQNIWVVGSGGLILKFNGYSWIEQPSGVTTDLKSVFVLDQTHIWAVGSGGVVLKYDGTTWGHDSEYNALTSKNLLNVHGTGTDNIWATGEGGVVLRYFDSTWSIKETERSTDYSALFVLDDANLWIGGADKTVTHWDGTSFDYFQIVPSAVSSIFAFSAEDIWVTGSNGTYKLVKKGVSYGEYYDTSSPAAHSIRGAGTKFLVLVGDLGKIYLSKGINEENSGISNSLRSITGIDSDNIWTVGDQGKILKRQSNGDWLPETNLDLNNLNYVFNDGLNVWAVGENGTVLKREETGVWTKKASDITENKLYAGGASGSYVFVVGEEGTILRSLDGGETWAVDDMPQDLGGLDLYTVFVKEEKGIFAAGENEIIIQYDPENNLWMDTGFEPELPGRSFRYFIESGEAVFVYGDKGDLAVSWGWWGWGVSSFATVFSNTNLGSTAGTSAIFEDPQHGEKTVFYQIGDGSYLLRSYPAQGSFNGPEYTFSHYFSTPVHSIYAPDINNVYVVGDQGKIFHYDGDSLWDRKPDSIIDNVSIYDMKALASNKIWAVGRSTSAAIRSRIMFYDGANWSIQYQSEFTGMRVIQDIDGTDENNLWAVGYYERYKYDPNLKKWDSTEMPGIILNAISVVDSDNIWAVGNNGVVFHNWEAVLNWGMHGNINSIYYESSDSIWMAGTGGQIYNYNPVTAIWTDKSVPGFSQNLTSIVLVSPNDGWAVGAKGSVLRYNGSTWSPVDHGISEINSLQLNKIIKIDNALWIVGNSGTILNFNGSKWTKFNAGIETDLAGDLRGGDAVSARNIWIGGASGNILNYTVPNDSIADKLLLSLPNENFIARSSTGIVANNPQTHQKVGVPFSVSLYAVDNNNSLDLTNGTTTVFETGGNYFTTPGEETLGLSKDATCGVGSVEVTFIKPGTHTLKVLDKNGALASFTSPEIVVDQGDPKNFYVTSSLPTKTDAGKASKITIGIKDEYGNILTASNNIPLFLSSNAASGRFSNSARGPWSESMSELAFSPGSSSVDFYYLDYASNNNSTITISQSNMNSLNINFKTDTSKIDQQKTRLSVSDDNILVGKNATVQVYLSANDVVNKKIILYSSRGMEKITNLSGNETNEAVTGSNGMVSFNISSTISGSTNLFAYDETDNVWLASQKTLNFLSDKPSFINIFPAKNEVIAGDTIGVSIVLKDVHNNESLGGPIKISSSDDKAVFPTGKKISEARKPISLARAASKSTFNFDIILKTAGKQSITVLDEQSGVSNSVKVMVKPSSFSASTSLLSTSKNKLVLGREKAKIKVDVTDKHGNGLSDKKIKINFHSDFGVLEASSEKTDNSGGIDFEFTPKKVGKVEFSAYNETDKTYFGSVEIEILSDTTINNAVSLIDSLQNNPVAKTIAKVANTVVATVASLGLIPIIASVVSSAPATAHAVTYAFSLGLEAIGVRKKRRAWGRVYDSTTGQGIDMATVRLFNSKTMKLISTVVTDLNGRYSFQPEPGIYTISVVKQNYIFPTSLFAQYGIATIDKAAQRRFKHYVGQIVTISSENNLINVEIPIDPFNKKPSLWLKIKVFLRDAFDFMTGGLAYVFIPSLIFGAVLSIFATIIIPNPRNLTISLIYTLVALIYLLNRLIKSGKFSLVYDSQTKKPVSEAVVSLFDRRYGALKETRITDKFGRFSIFIPKGEYRLKVEKEDYVFPSQKIRKKRVRDGRYRDLYFGEDFNVSKEKFVNISVPMDKK